ncbi:MAG: hypothetical protein VKP62_04240 [Candidatus Sericytochromatia bacterium]|nr:hypothetical protein [Candidatus Sericytochromatia bacterium]
MSLKSLVVPCVAACVLLTHPAIAMAQEDGDMATVVQTGGSVRGAIAPAAGWTDVRNGLILHTGDTLKTGVESYVEVVLPSGSRAALSENTIARLVDLEGLGLNLRAGRMRVVAPPEGTLTFMAGSLRVSGSDAEAVIERGGGGWRLAVLSGAFRVSDAGKNPTLLEAGRSAIFTSGGGEPRYNVITRSAVQDLSSGFGPDGAAASSASAARGGSAPNPWVAAGLSTLLPGVGQIYAGEVPRGLLYLGAEFALLGTGAYGIFTGQRQLAMYAGAGLLGVNLVSPLDAAFSLQNSAPAAAAAASPAGREALALTP